MTVSEFVVFEGIDGSGTSTQIAALKKRLEEKKVFFTCEPTDLETGKFLRKVLKGEISVAAQTAAYLFAADRCEHVYGKGGIAERCAKKEVCICDRYLFSSLAYQSIECGEKLPAKLNEDFPLPQTVFYFRIDPEIALKRIQNRSVVEIYEKLDFLQKTAAAYDKIFAAFDKKNTGMNIIRIDAALDAAEIEKIIWSALQKLPIFES